MVGAWFAGHYGMTLEAVRKQLTPTELDRIAASFEPALAEAMRSLFAAWQDAIPLDLLLEVIVSGRTAAALDAINRFVAPAGVEAEVAAVLEGIAGEVMPGELDPFGLVFDLDNPFVAEYASTMITGISDQTRETVTQMVRRAHVEGIPPRRLARLLHKHIPLLPRHEESINTWIRDALDRGESFNTVAATAEKMGARRLRWRLRNIARTETMRAANESQLTAWQELESAGLIENVSREWIITPDDRVCSICAPLDGVTVEGLGSRFRSSRRATSFRAEGSGARFGPGGVLLSENDARVVVDEWEEVPGLVDVRTPPAHPSCRCTTGLVYN